MKAREFLSEFLDLITQKADLPAARELIEHGLGIALDLEAEVKSQRVKNSIMLVILHVRSNHGGRIYPKRLDELERKLLKTKALSVEEYVDSLLLACSCDYLLELPKPKEWSTDEALLQALTCGLSIGLGAIIPDHKGRFSSLDSALLAKELEEVFELLGVQPEPHDHPDTDNTAVH